MAYHFVLYTKPNCVKCKMTKRLLDQYHANYQTTYYNRPDQPNLIDLNDPNPTRRAWSAAKIAKFKAQGIQSMPVVKVVDDASSPANAKPVFVDQWSDFRPDKIKAWAQRV